MFSFCGQSNGMRTQDIEESICEKVAQELAKKMLENKYDEERWDNEYSEKECTQEEYNKTVKKLLEDYPHYEKKIDRYKKRARKSIHFCVCGHIDYFMTPSEVVDAVKKRFAGIEKNGKIISKNEFEKIREGYVFGMRISTQDLSRIWGIEYIREKMRESKEIGGIFDVPDYVIVVDDLEKGFTVSISSFRQYPVVNYLSKNAKIYFKKIIGSRVANCLPEKVHRLAFKIGYRDFNDPGNIIKCEKTGKFYIVYTEEKSFTGWIQLPINLFAAIYFEGRFNYLRKINNCKRDPWGFLCADIKLTQKVHGALSGK